MVSLFGTAGPTTIKDFLKIKFFHTWDGYKNNGHGVSPWWSIIDWACVYPFEVEKPKNNRVYRGRGFELKKLKTCTCGEGCNEYLFIKK